VKAEPGWYSSDP